MYFIWRAILSHSENVEILCNWLGYTMSRIEKEKYIFELLYNLRWSASFYLLFSLLELSESVSFLIWIGFWGENVCTFWKELFPHIFFNINYAGVIACKGGSNYIFRVFKCDVYRCSLVMVSNFFIYILDCILW